MEIPSEEENSPTTNSTMNNVEDVVFQILLRLPVPSLLRFRCVCKEWCSMINTPLFKDTYLALRRAAAMAVDDDDQVVALISTLVSDLSADLTVRLSSDMDYAISMTCWYGDYQSLAISAWTPSSNEFEISGIHFSMMRIVNHVNGIVCINGMNWDDIFLVNPALRETRKLPIPNFFDLNLDLGRFKCHPQGKIGFGYDDSDDEYKVVVIVMVFEGDTIDKYIGLVYHLSTNSWKILGYISAFVPLPYMYAISPESVFSHGSIHWCMQLKIDEPYNNYYYQYRILAFDVSNELFREIQLPRGWRHHDDFKFPVLLTIDKSSIALVNCPDNHDASDDVQELEVWVMKEYGDSDSWTKRYSIRLSLPRFRSPLSFWKKDKLLLLVDSKLVCYDLFKGQLDEPPEHGYPTISVPVIQRLQLVTGHESFVSVKQV